MIYNVYSIEYMYIYIVTNSLKFSLPKIFVLGTKSIYKLFLCEMLFNIPICTSNFNPSLLNPVY